MPQLPSLAETGLYTLYSRFLWLRRTQYLLAQGWAGNFRVLQTSTLILTVPTNIHQSSWFALSISSTSVHATTAIPRRNRITLYSRFLWLRRTQYLLAQGWSGNFRVLQTGTLILTVPTNIHQSSWFALSISSTSVHATTAIPRRNRITLYSRFLWLRRTQYLLAQGWSGNFRVLQTSTLILTVPTHIHQSSWFALSISSTSVHATTAIPRRNRITLYSRFLWLRRTQYLLAQGWSGNFRVLQTSTLILTVPTNIHQSSWFASQFHPQAFMSQLPSLAETGSPYIQGSCD